MGEIRATGVIQVQPGERPSYNRSLSGGFGVSRQMRGLQYFPSKVHSEKLHESALKEAVSHVRKPEQILGSRADILASMLLQFSAAGAAQDSAHEIFHATQSDYVGEFSRRLMEISK